MQADLGDQRISYDLGALREEDVQKHPIAQFKIWYNRALDTPTIVEANAMIICTATKDGVPSARPVLLKAFDDDGFIFYTNYDSRKSKEIKENPKAAIVFYWEALERTIRIEGDVEKVSEEQSTEYFHSRPKGSQIGAWTSHQSRVVEDREEIDKKAEEVTKKFEELDVIPKPEFWGGWRVKPLAIEFWQGRKNRLHDRIVYKRESLESQEWKIQRLSP